MNPGTHSSPEEQPYDCTLRQKYGKDSDNRELDEKGVRYFPNEGPASYDNRKERNLRLKGQDAKYVKARMQTQEVKDNMTLKPARKRLQESLGLNQSLLLGL